MTLGELIRCLQLAAVNTGPDVEVIVETPNSDEYGLYTPCVVTFTDHGATRVEIECRIRK